jgi:hypothetical protein
MAIWNDAFFYSAHLVSKVGSVMFLIYTAAFWLTGLLTPQKGIA